MRLDGEKRTEKLKELKKACCFTTESCDKRTVVCGKLAALRTFVLSRGDVEAYVGLAKASKGRYLDAAREIESGERALNFEDELRSVYSRIRASA